MEKYDYLGGSGARAMGENYTALREVRAKLEELARKAESGEIVDEEVKRVNDLIRRLEADQELIKRADGPQ